MKNWRSTGKRGSAAALVWCLRVLAVLLFVGLLIAPMVEARPEPSVEGPPVRVRDKLSAARTATGGAPPSRTTETGPERTLGLPIWCLGSPTTVSVSLTLRWTRAWAVSRMRLAIPRPCYYVPAWRQCDGLHQDGQFLRCRRERSARAGLYAVDVHGDHGLAVWCVGRLGVGCDGAGLLPDADVLQVRSVHSGPRV